MKTKIGLVQMRCAQEPAANTRRALAGIADAARRGAKIICLPEMYRTPYFCQREDASLFNLAEPARGPSHKAFTAAAKKHKVVIVAPIFEKRAPGLYHNSAIVIDADGRDLGLYRKMHIPDDPCFYEKFYFTPGDLGFKAFDTAHGRIGVLICWDQWYPEAARLTALQGAEVLFYPTAIGWHPHEKAQYGAQQRSAWQTVQRGHAIANGCYVAAVNRIGLEKPDPKAPGLEFWGTSFVSDPLGVVLAEGATGEEQTLVADVDTARIEEVRRGWPFLRDRRIDAYDGITQRFAE